MTTTDEVPMPEPSELHVGVYGYTEADLRAYADARCAALEAVIHERNQSLRKWADWCKEAEAERDALAERVKALEADARRLDYLDSGNITKRMGWHVRKAPAGNVFVTSVIFLGPEPVTIRAAIDAAIGGDET